MGVPLLNDPHMVDGLTILRIGKHSMNCMTFLDLTAKLGNLPLGW